MEYTLIDKQKVSDINGECEIYEHNGTKAKVVFMTNEDDNLSMSIYFKTPPKNNKGIPHIIEHSVFNGSEKYPLKDPFVELMKGSMNTFLNAVTYNEATNFPVASNNEKDFDTLVGVYLDAVFSPLFLTKEEVFLQEGWHYEVTADNVRASGVVYNEMSGMASSPDFILSNKILATIFPDTDYVNVSGGIPVDIVDLTYDEVREYYREYYHPSNCVIFFYGKQNISKRLEMLSEYFDRYEYREIDGDVGEIRNFCKPVYEECEYPATNEDEGAFLSYSIVIDEDHSARSLVIFHVIDYILCASPAACIREAMLDKEIGEDFCGYVSNHAKQTYYTIESSYCREEDGDCFVKVIEDTLRELVKNGIDKSTMYAALQMLEFMYREDDYTNTPKGIVYASMLYQKMLHGEANPIDAIQVFDAIEEVRALVETDFFEKYIEEKFINNPFKAMIAMKPVEDYMQNMDDEIEKKVADYYASCEASEVERREKILCSYQNMADSELARNTIPVLEKSDLAREKDYVDTKLYDIDGVKLYHQDIKTNGIGYFSIQMGIRCLPLELVPYTRILAELFTITDTKKYEYAELGRLIDLHTGGVSDYVTTYVDEPFFIAHTSFMYNQAKIACELSYDILCETDFSDKEYIYEMLMQLKAVFVGQYTSGNTSITASIGNSQFSEGAAYLERIQGYEFYKFLCELTGDFDNRWQEFVYNVERTVKLLTAKDNVEFIYVGENSSLETIMSYLKSFVSRLNDGEAELSHSLKLIEKKNYGYIIPSSVQYITMCGLLPESAKEVFGNLLVLEHILNCEYLWQKVRVCNGAYGGEADFSYEGLAVLSSYRDPGLAKTIEAFAAIPDYISKLQLSDRELRQYIVGTMSDIDAPESPEMRGTNQINRDFCGISIEESKRLRNQIIDTTVEDIRNLAPIMEEYIKGARVVAIGNEKIIKEWRFDKVEFIKDKK